MRLGGQLFGDISDPEAWIAKLREEGFTAAYFPLGDEADERLSLDYARAASEAGIVIAEVGAWSNPLSRNEEERHAKIAFCQRRLALADLVGARCCVNIAGSLGDKWDGPCAADLTEAAFDLVVETVRAIIDAVKPRRTWYTLEPMPWMHPDSPDDYLRLIAAVDCPGFAVHLDPFNLINCPSRYFANAEFLHECFRKLGPHIKSCHAKDLRMSTKFTTHIDETRPGLGEIDYRAYLVDLDRLDPDLPLMIEHLETEDECRLAAAHIRAVARSSNVEIH